MSHKLFIVSAVCWVVVAAYGRGADLPAIARQAALDRAGFSPGLIDGKPGAKTVLALKEFQAARQLAVTGQFDSATLGALQVEDVPTLISYAVTAADLRTVGPVPRGWNEKAKVKCLKYESLAALLAERGHCTRATVARLNPGVALEKLKVGASVRLPNVISRRSRTRAAFVEVDLAAKVVRAKDADGRTLALFHCSIAKFAHKRPHGAAKVSKIAFDPVYVFKPEMWPEVRNVKKTLIIPPGPRNPVGLCWIGLNLPGYGIHGTPNPELIGKTGSHGCIRLANWDAVRLGRMVEVGLPVRFTDK